MMGHITHEFLEKLLNHLHVLRKQKQQELERIQQAQQQLELQQQRRQSLSSSTESDNNEQQKEEVVQDDKDEEESPQEHWAHMDQKPKKEKFITKYQRRQQQRLKHLQQPQSPSQEEAPKLHHRAWVALPTDGDGVWQHSLEVTASETQHIV